MATIPLTPLTLVSTKRTVPLNGSPSSQDYNDDQNDGLIDLASLVSFVNGTLIPLLQVLPKLAATAGIEGRAINTDSTNLTALCFNSLTSTPLTVAQSLTYLQNLQTTLQSQMTSLTTQVAVLSSQLSSTNQNDISLTLQSYQATLNTLTAQVLAMQTSIQTAYTTICQVPTPVVDPLGEESSIVHWPNVMANNSYTCVCSVEDPTGYLGVTSWSYLPGGVGITVVVENTDRDNVHSGTIHAVAYPA